jgi:uncharacterized protein
MPPIQLLIKPASGSCNLRCRYCFYADVSAHRAKSSLGMMSLETLDRLLQQTFAYAEGRVSIAFQGGEPTLAGLPFYRAYIRLVEQYNTRNLPVQHGIQTNGILLDEDWAAFLAANQFLVGLSLDGTRGNHDRYRLNPQGEGSFAQVWPKVDLLRRHKVDFNVLTVITADTARRIRTIYPFFMEKGLVYQQYIPCLNPLDEPEANYPFTLTAELYGEFLCNLFDLWFADVSRGRFVYIQYFDNLIAMLSGRPPITCGMTGVCTPQLVVEADGSFYPCDFYVLDEYRLGNIHTHTLAELDAARFEGDFLKASLPRAAACEDCSYLPICRGGCRRHREPLPADGGASLNRYCRSYKRFFAHALPRLQYLASRRPRPN